MQKVGIPDVDVEAPVARECGLNVLLPESEFRLEEFRPKPPSLTLYGLKHCWKVAVSDPG